MEKNAEDEMEAVTIQASIYRDSGFTYLCLYTE